MRLASPHNLFLKNTTKIIHTKRTEHDRLTKLCHTGPNPPTTPRKRGLRQIRSSQARQAADRSRAYHGEEEGKQSRRAEIAREQSVVV
jgi:hypothetical protein